MYSPLLFTTSSHLSTNLSMPFRQKSPGLIKESVEPVFMLLFIVKGNAPHMVRQRAENMSGPDNLWVQGPENTADAEGSAIRAL